MKTLILFELIPEDNFFAELNGDYSFLQGVYINTYKGDEKKMNTLNTLIYNSDGDIIVKKLYEPTKDWDVFIKCGFLL